MKKTIRILAVIIAMTCIFSGTAFAQEKEVAVEKSSSIARADVIKYVYKVENGKLYRKDSTISVEDTLYHLGDSVDIIYLESIPSINACVSLKSER